MTKINTKDFLWKSLREFIIFYFLISNLNLSLFSKTAYRAHMWCIKLDELITLTTSIWNIVLKANNAYRSVCMREASSYVKYRYIFLLLSSER
jgi:hypothetical protein